MVPDYVFTWRAARNAIQGDGLVNSVAARSENTEIPW